MAYVDRESIKLKVRRYLMPNVDFDGTVSVENAERYFLKLLYDEPTANVEEVRHGEWKQVYPTYPRYVCTVCNHLFNNKNYNYCPHCGAKMDGGKRGSEGNK